MSPDHLLELEAIEAALAGERSDPALALIVEETRATAPRMTPAFAARLDTAVADGFPAARPSRRPRLIPAVSLAGATALAVAVLVAVLPGGGSHPQSLVAPEHAAGDLATTAPSAGGAATDSAIQPAPPSAAVQPAQPSAARRETARRSAAESVTSADKALVLPETAPAPPAARPRVQQHAAQLTLSTPAARLQDTADQVVAVTDRMGGYVQSSSVAARGRAGEASFDLRVPASRLNEALAALSRLGHVRGRSEQAQDITASYDSARSRLHDAQAERQGLLRALAAATTTQEIESIKARLRIVRSRIAYAARDLASVRHRANYSRVGVTLLASSRPAATHHGSGSSWTPGRALHDAGRVLSVAAGVAIVAAAGALPLGLLALLALLGARAARRRRREAALDGPAPAV